MANETVITVTGNLTDAPEIRFTQSGAAMAKFTVASTPGTFNKDTNQWVDGEAMFLSCTAWRQLAENAAESLSKGTWVVVTGRLRQHHWETDEGEKRSMFGLDVDEIGPSLRFAPPRSPRPNARAARRRRRMTSGPPRRAPRRPARPTRAGSATNHRSDPHRCGGPAPPRREARPPRPPTLWFFER